MFVYPYTLNEKVNIVLVCPLIICLKMEIVLYYFINYVF